MTLDKIVLKINRPFKVGLLIRVEQDSDPTLHKKRTRPLRKLDPGQQKNITERQK